MSVMRYPGCMYMNIISSILQNAPLHIHSKCQLKMDFAISERMQI